MAVRDWLMAGGAGVEAVRKRLSTRLKRYRARRGRSASRATFIGITGSSTKSTTTVLLHHLLSARGKTRVQAFNNSIVDLFKTLRVKPDNADFVVVEVGARGPGTIGAMAELLRPHVAIVTLIGLEHYTAFRTREAVALEKGKLVEAVVPGGFAVLNADDPHASAMDRRTAQRVVTFGRENACDYRVIEAAGTYPDQLRVVIRWRGGDLSLQTAFLAEHYWLPTAAAVATALELGVPPDVVAARVATFEPVQGRFNAIVIPGGPHFLLDTVKAPWGTLGLAFDALKKTRGVRKTLVLGYISDTPSSLRKYTRAYIAAAPVCDRVIFVGKHTAHARVSQADRDAGRFFEFSTPREAADHIKRTAIDGEVILLKGGVNLHLERLAMSWLHDVRCWELACGKDGGCVGCGLFGQPFERHAEIRRAQKRRRRWNSLMRPFRRRE